MASAQNLSGSLDAYNIAHKPSPSVFHMRSTFASCSWVYRALSVYTPEQLAKVECMWRTLGEGVCAMLHASGLSDEFWALAMDTMAYVY
eukprot:1179145-Prorocentrum_minimum.AAC.2